MGGRFEGVKASFRGYCEATSLHGWSYLASEPKVIAKAFWAIIIFISFVLCSIVLSRAVDDWTVEKILN